MKIAPNMTAPHSSTHSIIRHMPSMVAAGDGHPRVPMGGKKGMGMKGKMGTVDGPKEGGLKK